MPLSAKPFKRVPFPTRNLTQLKLQKCSSAELDCDSRNGGQRSSVRIKIVPINLEVESVMSLEVADSRTEKILVNAVLIIGFSHRY